MVLPHFEKYKYNNQNVAKVSMCHKYIEKSYKLYFYEVNRENGLNWFTDFKKSIPNVKLKGIFRQDECPFGLGDIWVHLTDL